MHESPRVTVWDVPVRLFHWTKENVDSTAKLAEVAKGGDEGATKAQSGEAVKGCKGCHDEYRVKEQRGKNAVITEAAQR